MGRVIDSVVMYGKSEGGFTFMGSGLVLMLGAVAVSISVFSLLVFACADHDFQSFKDTFKRRFCTGDCGDCLICGSGDGGGADGGDAGGGGDGGGGAGCGGGGGGGGA